MSAPQVGAIPSGLAPGLATLLTQLRLAVQYTAANGDVQARTIAEQAYSVAKAALKTAQQAAPLTAQQLTQMHRQVQSLQVNVLSGPLYQLLRANLPNTLTQLQNLATGVAANIIDVQGDVATLQTTVTSQGSSITTLQTASTNQASAITTLQATTGAMYVIRVDANGHISGFGLSNDGTESNFDILANTFAIIQPSSTWAPNTVYALNAAVTPITADNGLIYKASTVNAPGDSGVTEPAWPTTAGDTVTDNDITWTAHAVTSIVPFVVDADTGTVAIDGSLLVKGSVVADAISVGTLSAISANTGDLIASLIQTAASGYRVEIGTADGFGFPIWYGTGTKNAANSRFSVDAAGNVSFQGQLFNTLTDSNLRINCGNGALAPYAMRSSASSISYRQTGPVTLTLADIYSPTYTGAYSPYRSAFAVNDFYIDFHIHGDLGIVNVYVEVSYDGGAWTQLFTMQTDCDYRGSFSGALTYTSQNTSWGTMQVRVRTDTNTQNASASITAFNFAESTNAPGAVSGNNSNSTNEPPTPRTSNDTLAVNGMASTKVSNGSNLLYASGATLDSLEPAQPGADVTGDNRSASTTSLSNHIISDNFISNPVFLNGMTGWTVSGASGSWFITTNLPDAQPLGGNALATGVVNTPGHITGTELYPVDFSKTYLMEAWAYCYPSVAGNYIGFLEYDGNQAAFSHNSGGAYGGYCLNAGQAFAGFKYFSAEVTGNGGTAPGPNQFNENARFVVPLVISNDNSETGVEFELCMFRISEVAAGAKRGLEVTTSGSGRQIGDGLNLIPTNSAGLATSVWTGMSVSSVTDSSITLSSGVLHVGAAEVSYNGPTISGLSASTEYALYLSDPTYAGGTQTLYAVPMGSLGSLAQINGCVFWGYVTTHAPDGTGGGSSGPGTGGNVGGYCITPDMFLMPTVQARNVHLRTRVNIADNYKLEGIAPIVGTRTAYGPAVQITASDGANLKCGVTTPFTMPDGSTKLASELIVGDHVLTDSGDCTINTIDDLGSQPLVYINVGGKSFAAGADPGKRIYSHNSAK